LKLAGEISATKDLPSSENVFSTDSAIPSLTQTILESSLDTSLGIASYVSDKFSFFVD